MKSAVILSKVSLLLFLRQTSADFSQGLRCVAYVGLATQNAKRRELSYLSQRAIRIGGNCVYVCERAISISGNSVNWPDTPCPVGERYSVGGEV